MKVYNQHDDCGYEERDERAEYGVGWAEVEGADAFGGGARRSGGVVWRRGL